MKEVSKRIRSRKGAPGIVEVAKRAGVSPATVSRFYNNPDVVKLPTRKRIEQAASDLGYIRDRLAGALHNQFSGTIGLVVPTIDNAIFAEMIQAFSEQLRARDRTMLIATHSYDLSLETPIIRTLLERRIDGVAMIGFDHNPVLLGMLADRGVPVISVWNYDENAKMPCIGSDNFKAGHDLAGYLLQLGHREIAYVFPETGSNDRARNRKEGALQAAKEAGIDVPECRIKTCSYDLGQAKASMSELFSNDQPTAIVCCNDVIAQGAVYAAQASGLSVPADVSIVGIGDFRGSAEMEPGLTTIRIPARRIGMLSADAIVDMSKTGMDPNPYHRRVDAELVIRASAAPPKTIRN